jgi:regulator of replication initiation timing
VSSKHVKWILVVCLLVGLLVCGVGCIRLTRSINLQGNPNSLSVKGLEITMDANQREEYFSQMRKFADKHSLRFELSSYSSDNKRFIIAMYGDGFHITSSNISNSPRIAIAFFNDATTPTPQGTVDELMDDLKNFINEIPNTMITEVRSRLIITKDKNWRSEELLARMKTLAEKHSLEFKLSFYDTDKTLYLVEIYGDGFHITSDSLGNPQGEIIITFFIDYYKAPTSTSLEAVDELFTELKSLISEIPNVTIAGEK